MAIEFQCPNGHRILGPEQRAGQAAKCPKCGVGFRIPATSGAGSGIGVAEGAKTPLAPVVVPTAASTSSVAGSKNLGEEMMVFLCPNGHRLNGPARMQGKAGQCPHCGAKFIVPMIGESEEAEEMAGDDPGSENANAVHELLGALEREELLPANPSYSATQQWGISPSSSGQASTPMTASSAVHPLCDLMGKLWEEKQHGGIIEMHLEGGALLTPDWFDEPLSRQSHGLFAAQSADGTVTMTVVPWDKVTRVVVRNVEGLPHGMFE